MMEQKLDQRNHKIKSDYGVHDYYKYYNSNYKNRVTNYNRYTHILCDINQSFADKFSNEGYEIKFPKRMGMMCISKVKGKVWLDDNGKIMTNRPINYKATKDLWAKDPNAKLNKVLIRHENQHTDGYKYNIFYRRSTSNCKNRSVYSLHPNRKLARKFAKSLISGKINSIF